MKRDEIKCAMIAAVSKALGYKEQLNDVLDVNNSEVYQKVLSGATIQDRNAKIAMIAAISHALKYQQENPEANENEIVQYVMDKSDSILDAIEKNK